MKQARILIIGLFIIAAVLIVIVGVFLAPPENEVPQNNVVLLQYKVDSIQTILDSLQRKEKVLYDTIHIIKVHYEKIIDSIDYLPATGQVQLFTGYTNDSTWN